MQIAALILLFSVSVFAEGDMTIFLKDKPVPLKTRTYEKLKLSENCFKNNVPTCDAYTKGIKKNVKRSQSKIPMAQHPAAHYCLDLGAENRIAKDSSGAQYDYCLFPDGSLVDSWSLYNKHHSIEAIK